MQIQKKQKASILLWVFFLTLLMSFSFIFIQFQIKNSLRNNSKKLDSLKTEKKIGEFLGNINSKTQKIGENTLEIKNFSSLEYTLKKDENFELNFSETGSVNLELLNSGIISYALDSEELGKNTLATYNTGATLTGFLVFPGTELKIKNFSGYSKIRIGAGKIYQYIRNSNQTPILLQKLGNNKEVSHLFKKAGKITLSVYKNKKILFLIQNKNLPKPTNDSDYNGNKLIGNSNTKYTNKKFFIKAGDKLYIKSKTNSTKLIISGDYNLSDMLKNNSYKIYKKTWGKEIVLEKGKIN